MTWLRDTDTVHPARYSTHDDGSDRSGFSVPHRHSLLQKSPDSDSSSNSSDESFESANSVASSQTSACSQASWSIDVESDRCKPIGMPICLPNGRYVVSQPLPNPRRTSRDAAPPPLLRQNERKEQFVYHLVDSATYLVETIWPTSAPACHDASQQFQQCTLPLRTFIEETLRRSKTSFSTLQVALFYLVLLKDNIPAHDFTIEQPENCAKLRALQCGRRMFLAALILGSKYLQDRNYSARAWSKISGLRVCEINLNEMTLLRAVNWKLHIPEPTFNRWQDILVKYSQPSMVSDWRRAIRYLTPDYVANYRLSSAVPEATPISDVWAPQQSAKFRTDAMSWASTNFTPVNVSPSKPPHSYSTQSVAASSAFKLATPSPMSSMCPTPAASVASDMLRNVCQPRAMCAAMSMVSSAAARSCMESAPRGSVCHGSYDLARWRSSLTSNTARSSSTDYVQASIPSSPGSMVSDHETSRSSSVSSISLRSQNTSPDRNFLPRLATRNVGQVVDTSAAAAAVSYDDCVTVLDSEPLQANDLTASPEDIIVLEDEATPVQRSFDSVHESRKRRHRNSADIAASCELQESVRRLVRQKPAAQLRAMPMYYRKGSTDLGKPVAKKACYQDEVQSRNGYIRPEGGPGMWKNIIY